MYYVTQTPFGIEAGSVQAYEYAAAYPLFHWGVSAWSFYLVPGLAIGYLYWNKKTDGLQISKLCGNVIGGGSGRKRIIQFILDAIVVFCYFMMIMTTVGIGTPVMGELASELLGVSNTFGLKIGVILIFGLFFTLSTSKTIAKGMGKISDFNVKLTILMAAAYIEKLRMYMKKYTLQRDEECGEATISVGVIQGGSTPNVVPPYAKVLVDIRYLPGQDIAQYEEDLNQVMNACKKDWPEFDGKVKIIGNWNAMLTDRASEDFLNIKEAIQKGLEKEPKIGVMSGWGEGGFINMFGIPTIYFGPGNMELAHSPNEHISVNEIGEVARAYWNILMDFS